MWKAILQLGAGALLAGLIRSGVLERLGIWGWFSDMITLTTILYVLSAVLFVTGGVTWWRERRLASLRHFDIPIRDAIIHVVNTTDHSYGTPSLRESLAFQALHKQMCDGKLQVVSRER